MKAAAQNQALVLFKERCIFDGLCIKTYRNDCAQNRTTQIKVSSRCLSKYNLAWEAFAENVSLILKGLLSSANFFFC